MASKKQSDQVSERQAPEQPGGPPWVLIGGVLAVAALAVFVLYPGWASESPDAVAEADHGAHAPAPEQPAAPARPVAETVPVAAVEVTKPGPDAPMPPLPFIPNMVPRPAELIAEVYEYAGRNPDVLEFVPCFCGCETAGHRANSHCFVQSRNADGSVAAWEPHGMGCAVCIDVARDSMQMHASGATVRDIRAAIESKYASRFPRMTPTPSPPQAQAQ